MTDKAGCIWLAAFSNLTKSELNITVEWNYSSNFLWGEGFRPVTESPHWLCESMNKNVWDAQKKARAEPQEISCSWIVKLV